MHEFRVHLKNSIGSSTNGKFSVFVNNKLIDNYSLNLNLIEFTCDLVQGWNSFKIYLNKKYPDTSVSVEELYIDKSVMRYLMHDFGKVIPDYQVDPGLEQWYIENQGQAPAVFPKRKMLDMSGAYIFDFKMPLKEFLEDFYQLPAAYETHYNQSIQAWMQLEQKLNNIKNA